MLGNRRALVMAAVQLSRRFPAMQPHIVADLLVADEDRKPLCAVDFQGQRHHVWGIPDMGLDLRHIDALALALSCSQAAGYIQGLQLDGDDARKVQETAELQMADFRPHAHALLELLQSCKNVSSPSVPPTKPAS